MGVFHKHRIQDRALTYTINTVTYRFREMDLWTKARASMPVLSLVAPLLAILYEKIEKTFKLLSQL